MGRPAQLQRRLCAVGQAARTRISKGMFHGEMNAGEDAEERAPLDTPPCFMAEDTPSPWQCDLISFLPPSSVALHHLITSGRWKSSPGSAEEGERVREVF